MPPFRLISARSFTRGVPPHERLRIQQASAYPPVQPNKKSRQTLFGLGGSAAKSLHLCLGASDFDSRQIKGRSLPCTCRSPATAGDANGSSPLVYSCLAARTGLAVSPDALTQEGVFISILAQNTQKGKSCSAG